MTFQFWLRFFSSLFLCFLLSGFFGFAFHRFQSESLRQALDEKSVKLDNLRVFGDLDKKLSFLKKQIQKIKAQKKISQKSPFEALVLFQKSQVQAIYTYKKGKKNSLALLELSEEALQQASSQGFSFIYLQRKVQGLPRLVLVEALSPDTYTLAFLKEKKSFFHLSPPSSLDKEGYEGEFFALNNQGRMIFHSFPLKIFKKLDKKSPVLKSLPDIFKNSSSSARYLKSGKSFSGRSLYYLKKEKVSQLVLVSKAYFPAPPFMPKGLDFHTGIIGALALAVLIFFLLLFLLYRSISTLSSSYEFLKLAILSFEKTALFPPVSHPKNPLLYFYNNRRLFLNKRQSERKEEGDSEIETLSFQDILDQELEDLREKYPRLSVKKDYDFDVRVFGFERFLRVIVKQLFINALEAMGGRKEPKLDLSTQKEQEDFVFSVRDYGTGISKKDYKKVFRMYYSTKSKMGVGLNLAQNIVEANEGGIEFSSPEGGGLQVFIRLPLKCFLKNQSFVEV